MNTINLKAQKGYVALISTIIICMVLLGLSFTVSASGFFTRFDVLHNEFKRVSLGLAESCANAALLKIGQDYDYAPGGNGEKVAVGTNECTIKSISYTETAQYQKIATITTTASYKGAFSNIQVSAMVQDPGEAPVSKASLTVLVQMVNHGGGSLQPANFEISVPGASQETFQGSGGDGTTVYINAGQTFNVIAATAPNYEMRKSSGEYPCRGTASIGESYTCVITYTYVPTTATLIVSATIINDDGGPSLLPEDVPLFIDDSEVTSGTPTNLNYGSHTVSSLAVSNYTVSGWGGDCGNDGTITLEPGDIKTCEIIYDDIPPITPSCADTVIMLDHTGSMSNVDVQNEKDAVYSLLNLYSRAGNPPSVGIGSFGGVDGSYASIPHNYSWPPASGRLTDVYGNNGSDGNGTTGLYRVTDYITIAPKTDGTNIYAAINTGVNELYSARHTPDAPRVLILVSDGEANQPSGHLFPVAEGNYKNWTANTGTKTNAVSKNDSDTTYIANTGSDPRQTFVMANAGIPSWVTVTSVTLHAVARKTTSDSTNLQFMLEQGTGENQQVYEPGTPFSLTSGYRHYEYRWTRNPFTGTAWTVAEVNNWPMKFGVNNFSAVGSVPRVTRLYLVVEVTSNANDIALEAAARAKQSGVQIFTVYYNNEEDNTAAINLLTGIASTPNDYFYSPRTADDISAIFNTIGQRVCPAVNGDEPFPPPTTGRLIVKTHVINDYNTKTANDFRTTVQGDGDEPLYYDGSEEGVTVVLQPGNYTVSQTEDSEYVETLGTQCSGSIAAGQTITCTIINDDIPLIPPLPPPASPPPPNITIGSWVENE